MYAHVSRECTYPPEVSPSSCSKLTPKPCSVPDRVYGRKTVAVVLLNWSFTGRMLSDFGEEMHAGGFRGRNAPIPGRVWGLVRQGNPWGGAGGFGIVATAWPELPEAIKAASWRWSRPPRGARNSRGSLVKSERRHPLPPDRSSISPQNPAELVLAAPELMNMLGVI